METGKTVLQRNKNRYNFRSKYHNVHKCTIKTDRTFWVSEGDEIGLELPLTKYAMAARSSQAIADGSLNFSSYPQLCDLFCVTVTNNIKINDHLCHCTFQENGCDSNELVSCGIFEYEKRKSWIQGAAWEMKNHLKCSPENKKVELKPWLSHIPNVL